MILALDTSTKTCKLSLVELDWRYDDNWLADRSLADHLLKYINDQLQNNNKTIEDISAIVFYSGPGSFTGLRIGATVVNTIADSLSIPIVAQTGIDWQGVAISRLDAGDNDGLVLPFYGSEPNITQAKK